METVVTIVIWVRLVLSVYGTAWGLKLVWVAAREYRALVAAGATRVEWLVSSGKVRLFATAAVALVAGVLVAIVPLVMELTVWRRLIGNVLVLIVVICLVRILAIVDQNRRAIVEASRTSEGPS